MFVFKFEISAPCLIFTAVWQSVKCGRHSLTDREDLFAKKYVFCSRFVHMRWQWSYSSTTCTVLHTALCTTFIFGVHLICQSQVSTRESEGFVLLSRIKINYYTKEIILFLGTVFFINLSDNENTFFSKNIKNFCFK